MGHFPLTLFMSVLACLYSLSFYRRKPPRGWLRTIQSLTAIFDFSLEDLGGFSYGGLILSECSRAIPGTSDDPLDVVGSAHLCVSQELHAGVLLSWVRPGMFSLPQANQSDRHGCALIYACLPDSIPLAPFARFDQRAALLFRRGFGSQFHGDSCSAVLRLALLALAAAVAITVPLFILNAMVFIPLGQIVGGYLEKAPRGIFAYSVNILAALADPPVYIALPILAAPVVWFAVAGVILVLLVGKVAPLRWASIVTIGLCLTLFLIHPRGLGHNTGRHISTWNFPTVSKTAK